MNLESRNGSDGFIVHERQRETELVRFREVKRLLMLFLLGLARSELGVFQRESKGEEGMGCGERGCTIQILQPF